MYTVNKLLTLAIRFEKLAAKTPEEFFEELAEEARKAAEDDEDSEEKTKED